MNNTSRFALLLLLFAGAAVGVFFMLKGESGGELPPRVPGTTTDPNGVEDPGEGTPIQGNIAVDRQRNEGPERTELAPATNTGADYAQGVMGTVYDPNGNPVYGARVFLMEGSNSDVFRRFQAIQEGVVFPPTASGQTSEQGRFALGLSEPVPNAVFEVRIVTDQYADYTIPNLTIHDGDWYEAPNIVLEAGTMVHGRVTFEGQGLGVPGAVVYIKSAGGFAVLAATPGREQGLEVEVDENGYFQVHNAPEGVVDISAAAPYFAREEQRGVNLDPMTPNEVNFELSRGLAIRGIVTDPSGQPVSGARVMANSLLPKQPQNEETRTSGDGHFEFLSLVEAPFQLTAMARGFQRQEEKPVQAGAEDVQLILEKQGGARVRVSGRGNRLLRSYLLSVKSHFAAQNQIGNVQNQSPRNIRGSDLDDGFASVGNLNAGDYVFQIDAQGYARTFSDPFTVGPGIQPPDVEMQMSMGGTITGTVLDANGRPARGVAVLTQSNGMVENAFLNMLGSMIPRKITEMLVQTDAEGRYRLDVLAEGQYQLKFTHPQFCEVVVKDLVVEEGLSSDVPVVTLLPGTLVTGTTMVDGAPAGQVKVTIQLKPPEQGQASVGAFSAEAVSDSRGQYTIPKRLPPGVYQIMATRQPDNPFGIILDYEKTRMDFSVLQGQTEMVMNVNVPTM